MAHIIAVVQVKGGAGRSTIATNLAGLLSRRLKTVLIDCDMPQGTAAAWYAIRAQDKPETAKHLTLRAAHFHTELVREVEATAGEADVLVIDCPPRIAEVTRAALILADLALVPLGASAAEIWATTDLLKTVDEARKVKPQVDARILWNRIRANTRAAHELPEAVRDFKLKELETRLGYRVAYSEALARGLTVLEWPDELARAEMLALGQEVGRIISHKQKRG